MPSLWRMPLSEGYPSSHRPKARKPQTTLLQALMLISLAPMQRPRKETTTPTSPTASTRACSSLQPRGAIVTGSTCVMSPNKHVSSAAADPHHLRYLQARALGRKASDEFAVPLCRSHHRAVHRAGDEQAWWKAAGIDPVKIARQLWRRTRLDDPQEHHQAGLAARPETPSIASAPDSTRESRPDQVAIERADDGRTP